MKLIFKIGIVLLFIFLNVSFTFGQRTYPLEESAKNKRQGVYLNVKMVDSLDYLKIFLVNRSEKKYRYYGLHQYLEINTEAKNQDGEWLSIDPVGGLCLTGYGYSSLPSNNYTKIKKDKFSGDFKTEVRFSVSIKDSILFSEPTIVYSEPIEMNIPSGSFKAKYDWRLNKYEKRITETNDFRVKSKFAYRKALIGHKFDDIEFVKKELIRALSFDQKNGNARFSLSNLYMKYWNDNQNKITINDEAILICASINEMEKINLLEFPDKKRNVMKYIKMGKDYFSKKENWNPEEIQDCKIIDGKYKCFEKHFIKDYVELRFKQ